MSITVTRRIAKQCGEFRFRSSVQASFGRLGQCSISVDPYFTYIGASDLVPEVRKHKDLGVNIVNFISFLIGVSLMWIIKIVLGS